MKLSDKYYTGREVQRILSISEPSLRNLVQQKKIRKIRPPGRKNGVYLKSDIDHFAAQWEAFLMAKEPPKATFVIPSINDMEEENDLDRRTVGGAGMTAEVRQSWLEIVPDLDYHVRFNGKLVAFLRLLPLKHEIIEAFMNGKMRGKDIPADALVTLEPNKPIECLLIGISSDPDVSETIRMHYMTVLLRNTAKELMKQGEKGINFTKLYATSESPTGIAMALHAGMQEIPPRLGKRIRFVLEVDKADSFLAKSYQQGFNEWKKSHGKERHRINR